MDELRKLLLRKLHERYPGNIPAFIKERFDKELGVVWKDVFDGFFPLYQTIMKTAEVSGQPVWNCGFGNGSFLFYLLDKGLNPLPPHWECKGCGHIETDEHAVLCFDLPARDCPDCKKQMVRDGIHSSVEEALRSTHFEIRVNEDFLEAANQAALSALKDRRAFQRRWNHNPAPDNYHSYYLTDKCELLVSSLIHQDESGHEYINVEDERNCSVNLLSVVIIGQTNYAMPKNARPMEEWIESKPDIQSFLQQSIQDMKARGDYYPENTEEQILKMIHLMQPETWTALIEIVCYASGNYTRTGKNTIQELVELIQGSDFRHVLYSREALQFYLRKEGVPEILDWQMVEQLRRGWKGWEKEIYEEETPLLEKDELFNAVMYMRSRTHSINWLWRYLDKTEEVSE